MFIAIFKDLHVNEVRKLLDDHAQDILQTIEKKMENASEARINQLNALQEKLRDHVGINRKQFFCFNG